MDKPPDKPPLSEWRKESWATRQAKKREHELPPVAWEQKPDGFDYDPKCYEPIIQHEAEQHRTAIQQEIASGAIIVAERAVNPKLVKLQDIINQLATASGLFETPPKLLIHKLTSQAILGADAIEVGTMLPEFIHINQLAAKYFLESESREEFKAVIAHELGHIACGDRSVENQAISFTRQPNQKNEILADRMGAIIHGNPKEYAKFKCHYEFPYTKTEEPVDHPLPQEYLSINKQARMLHKWADILENEGATDKNGNVIVDKALAVFKRSEALTEDLLKMDLAIRGR